LSRDWLSPRLAIAESGYSKSGGGSLGGAFEERDGGAERVGDDGHAADARNGDLTHQHLAAEALCSSARGLQLLHDDVKEPVGGTPGGAEPMSATCTSPAWKRTWSPMPPIDQPTTLV